MTARANLARTLGPEADDADAVDLAEASARAAVRDQQRADAAARQAEREAMTTTAHAINATATRDTTCTRCAAVIPKGARCAVFRERALSSAEARNAGSLYPKRRWCASCASGAAQSTPTLRP